MISFFQTLQNMFQNLNDISDLTFSIVASFEDILEMNEDKQSPLIGSCLEEFAEVQCYLNMPVAVNCDLNVSNYTISPQQRVHFRMKNLQCIHVLRTILFKRVDLNA